MSNWTTPDGTQLQLLRPEELSFILPGTVLRSINGQYLIWGDEKLDDLDTRAGYLAWGIIIPEER